jgi:hypothetical protein
MLEAIFSISFVVIEIAVNVNGTGKKLTNLWPFEKVTYVLHQVKSQNYGSGSDKF